MAEIVLLIGCFSTVGLWSILFNSDTGKFNVLKQYDNFANVSYFAKVYPSNFVYATSRSTPNDLLYKFLHNGAPGDIAVNQSKSLHLHSSAYLYARNLTATSRRLAIAYYGGSGIQFIDNDNNGFVNNGASFNFTHFSNATNRQEAPHPHCIIPMNHTTVTDYFVTDLGADRVYMVNYNGNSIIETNHFELSAGSGPRHIIRHPTADLIFLLNELNSSLVVYKEVVYGQTYTPLNQYTTLVNATNENIDTDPTQQMQIAGHLALTPDGKYIVCSNRGIRNSIVVFQLVDQTLGTLTVRSANGSGGYHPRYFEIYGNWLIVANMRSNNTVSFQFNDGVIGEIVDTLTSIPVPVSMIVASQIQDSSSVAPTTKGAVSTKIYLVVIGIFALISFYLK